MGRKKEQGGALPIVLIFMLIFTVLGLGFMNLGAIESQLTTSNLSQKQALYVAQAGVERAIQKLKADSVWRGAVPATGVGFAAGDNALAINVSLSGTYQVIISDSTNDGQGLYDATLGANEVKLEGTGTVAGASRNIVAVANLGSQMDADTVALWHFNEGSGGKAFDASNYGNHADIFPDTGGWNAGGKFNWARDYNGTSRYVEAPNSSSLNPTAAITIEAWVYPRAKSNQWIVAKGILGYGLYLGKQSNQNRIGSQLPIGGRLEMFLSNDSVPLDVWTHVALTYDGTTAKLYKNGVLDNSMVYGGPMDMTGDPLRIGTLAPSNWFTGLIDEVRISKVARTSFPLTEYQGTTSAVTVASWQE
ncbi:MAG TPA: LamG-like jellyroll fold domain-containing protein, partial [bacterium]|nr:LamG-like jellyroll fold domain-containing protein [bacterium]